MTAVAARPPGAVSNFKKLRRNCRGSVSPERFRLFSTHEGTSHQRTGSRTIFGSRKGYGPPTGSRGEQAGTDEPQEEQVYRVKPVKSVLQSAAFHAECAVVAQQNRNCEEDAAPAESEQAWGCGVLQNIQKSNSGENRKGTPFVAAECTETEYPQHGVPAPIRVPGKEAASEYREKLPPKRQTIAFTCSQSQQAEKQRPDYAGCAEQAIKSPLAQYKGNV